MLQCLTWPGHSSRQILAYPSPRRICRLSPQPSSIALFFKVLVPKLRTNLVKWMITLCARHNIRLEIHGFAPRSHFTKLVRGAVHVRQLTECVPCKCNSIQWYDLHIICGANHEQSTSRRRSMPPMPMLNSLITPTPCVEIKSVVSNSGTEVLPGRRSTQGLGA